VAIWLIFRVAHSLRINADMLVVRALKIGQMTDGCRPPTYDSMHYSANPPSMGRAVPVINAASGEQR